MANYNKFNPIIHAAVIPGSSIGHHKLGMLPHEKPPEITDKNEALEYFWKMLIQPKIQRQIWDILKMPNSTIWAMTKTIIYKAALTGVIQMNLGMTLAPVVSQMIDTIAKAGGVNATKWPKTTSPQRERYIKQGLKKLLVKYDKKGWLTGKQSANAPIVNTPMATATDMAQSPQTQNPNGDQGQGGQANPQSTQQPGQQPQGSGILNMPQQQPQQGGGQ